jgi:murein DD-endopeptidase MepM/ murein hydrolase activator NlpD
LTPSIIGETNKTFDIEVNAKWYESEEKEYYGDASYKFTANVSAPAYFYLGENTIEHGEFVVLTAKNILDINAINFKSEPAINYTPTFYKEGDYVVALIPISVTLDYSPAYVFTVSSGGVTEELTLTVTERAKKNNIYSKASAELANKSRTQAILDSFTSALKSTINTNETTRYWEDLFIEPAARQVRWGFGRNVIISSTGGQYINTGVDYMVVGGDQVSAVNKGKVVYVGEQLYSGKLVVVDHGYGLKSWYMNLSTISVNVGDMVEKGAALGVVGDTGYNYGGVSLHYELTVHGIPVCPYSLNDEGIKMYIGE